MAPLGPASVPCAARMGCGGPEPPPETYWGTTAAATMQAAQVPSGGHAVPWTESPEAWGSQNTTQAEPKTTTFLNSN